MTSWCQWVINIVIEVQISKRLFTCLFTHCCLFAIGIRLPVVYLTHILVEQQYRTAQYSRVAVFKTNGMSRSKLKVLILPTEHWFVYPFIHSVFEWAAAGWSEWHSSWRTPIANHCDEGDWWTHEEMESMFLPNELNCWKEFWWFGKFPFNHCEIGFILNCRLGTFGAVRREEHIVHDNGNRNWCNSLLPHSVGKCVQSKWVIEGNTWAVESREGHHKRDKEIRRWLRA